jgi:5-methylcytosine-specific restriction protein A
MSDRPSLSNTKRVRLFEMHGGLCHICGEKIDGVREKWEVEHVIPRAILGKTADTDDNMKPAHIACHALKTSHDRVDIAKVERIRLKHIGAYQSKSPMNRNRKPRTVRRSADELARMNAGRS